MVDAPRSMSPEAPNAGAGPPLSRQSTGSELDHNNSAAVFKKGQRVRATLKGLCSGVVFCDRGDAGVVQAVEKHAVADMEWDNGSTFPTTLYYLERVGVGDGPLRPGDLVMRTRPVLNGKGAQILAAGQVGRIVGVQERVRVAVLFDRSRRTPEGGIISGPSKAMWMAYGLEAEDSVPEHSAVPGIPPSPVASENEGVDFADVKAPSQDSSPRSTERSMDEGPRARRVTSEQGRGEHQKKMQEEELKLQVDRLIAGSNEQKATAAEMLAAHTKRSDGVQRAGGDERIFDGLVRVLNPQNMPPKGALMKAQLQAAVTVKNLATVPHNRQRFGSIPGSFSGLVRMLQGDNDAAAQQQAALALGNLANECPANQEDIGQEPEALHNLAKLLEPGYPSPIQEAAAGALTHLSIGCSQNITLIGELPTAVVLLCQLIEPENSPKVQLQAVIVLGNIAVGNLENQERICAMPGALISLTELLGPTNHTLVRMEAAVTVKNIAAENAFAQQRIGSAPELLRALSRLLEIAAPIALREEAAATLYNLAFGSSVMQRQVAHTPGTLKGLADLLVVEESTSSANIPASAREKAAQALKSIVAGSPESATALLQEVPDILETLSRLIARSATPAEVRQSAIATLTTLALESAQVMARIGDISSSGEAVHAGRPIKEEQQLFLDEDVDEPSLGLPGGNDRGLLEAILRLLTPGTPRDLQKEAAGALLAVKASAHNRCRLREVPGAVEILERFSSEEVDGSTWASEVLRDLRREELDEEAVVDI